MALSAGTAYVDIVPRIARNLGTDLQRQLNSPIEAAGRRAERSVEASGQRITTSFSGMASRLAALAATAFAGLGAVNLFRGAISGASDLEESVNKVGVVFGQQAPKIRAFAENAATALGQSRQQALEATGTFGNLFVSMGLTTDRSADMSVALVKLASDLASFNNVDPAEALQALRSGLVGETEPLRRFGVNLNEATIQAKALQLGLVDTAADTRKVQAATLAADKATRKLADAEKRHGRNSQQAQDATVELELAQGRLAEATEGTVPQLDAAQKAQAAYALILEQTRTAQGDFARTSDGLANRQRILKARFQDLKAQLGNALLPVALRVAEAIGDRLGPAFERLQRIARGVKGLFDAFAAGLRGAPWEVDSPVHRALNELGEIFAEKVLPAMRAVWAFVKENLTPILIGLGTAIAANVLPDMLDLAIMAGRVGAPFLALAAAVAGLVKLYQSWPPFREKVDELVDGIEKHLLPALRAFGRFIGDVSRAFERGGFRAALDVVIGEVKEFTPRVLDALGEMLRAIGNWVTTTAWPYLREHFPGWVRALWEWIREVTPPALRALGEWLRAVGQWIVTTGLPALGRAALALGKALWHWIQDAGPPALRALGRWLASVGNWFVTEALPALGGWLLDLGLKFLDWITDVIPKIPGELGKLVGRIGAWIVTDGIPMLAGALLDLVGALLSWIDNAASAAPGKLLDFLKSVGSWLLNNGPRLLGELGGKLGNFLLAPFRFVFNAIAELWNNTVGKIKFTLPEWVPLIGGNSFSMPTINTGGNEVRGGGGDFGVPALHQGGIVPGRPGEDVLALLRAGEKVLPTGMAGRSGATFNVEIRNDDPGAVVDEMMARAAWRLAHVGSR